MYRKLWHFICGNVCIRVESPTPERILNLCAAHEIAFWDMKYLGETTLLFCLAGRDVPRLRRVSRTVQREITVVEETGAPRLMRNFHRRYVLWAAAVIFLALYWCGHTFIWDFSVTGNETVPTETILHALEDYGITLGTRAKGIDQKDLRNHVLLVLPDVSYLAVNVKGCTAHVQVVERHRPPEMVRDGDKTNVVAEKAGLVTKVLALDGEKQVLPGTTVTAGQLLISGTVDHPDHSGTRLLHARGEVWARTWYQLSVKIPLNEEEKQDISRRQTVFSVNFGKHHINFGKKGSILGVHCDKIRMVKEIFLPGGIRLPLTLCREQIFQYQPTVQKRNPQQVLQEGKSALLAQLNQQLSRESRVESTLFSQKTEGDWMLVTLNAECTEQIGVEIPIATGGQHGTEDRH